MVDPVSALGLAQCCLELASTVASTAKGIYGIISKLKDADKNAHMLASQMDLVGLVLSELQTWLHRDPPLSQVAKLKLSTAINSCGIIVTDISVSVQKVLPLPSESDSTLLQRMRHVWNEDAIREQRDMISTTLQAFQLIFSLTSLYAFTMPFN